MARAHTAKASLKDKILQMDLPGAALILAAVCCYVLAIQGGGIKKPWNSSEVIGLLVGFALIIIAFAAVEYIQGERALLPTRLIKDRRMIASCAFMALSVHPLNRNA